MNKLIETTMQSDQVRYVSEKFALSVDEAYELLYESGMAYLEQLGHRICRKRAFDIQFRPMLQIKSFKRMSVSDVFRQLSYSNFFWFWWSTQFLAACTGNNCNDSTELFIRLQFNTEFIPHFILKKIFTDDEIKNKSSRLQDNNATEAGSAHNSTRRVGNNTQSFFFNGDISRIAAN